MSGVVDVVDVGKIPQLLLELARTGSGVAGHQARLIINVEYVAVMEAMTFFSQNVQDTFWIHAWEHVNDRAWLVISSSCRMLASLDLFA